MARPRTASRSVENPSLDGVSLQQFLEALTDPVRRRAVAQLAAAGEALSCGTFVMPVAPSTATHHFNVLREAGVIRQYYVGTTKLNTLRAEELEKRFPGLLSSVLAAVEREGGAGEASPGG